MRFRVKITIEIDTESLDAYTHMERLRILTSKVDSVMEHGTVREAFSDAGLDVRNAWVSNAEGVRT